MKLATLLLLFVSLNAYAADLQLHPGQTVSFSQGYPSYKPGAAAEQATQISVCLKEKCDSVAIGKPVARLVQFQLDIAGDLINAHLAAGKSLALKADVEKILSAATELKNKMPAGARKYVDALEKRTAMAQVRVDAYESKYGPISAQASVREPSSR